MQALADIASRFFTASRPAVSSLNHVAKRRHAPEAVSGWTKLSSLVGNSLQSASGASARQARTGSPHDAERVPLWHLQSMMIEAIMDCQADGRTRLSSAIGRSRSGADLWQLRSNVFQVIALSHGEGQARNRLNAMMPLFAHWIPEKQLTTI